MELVVDDLHPGTDEHTWLSGSRLAALPPFQQRRPGRLIVVAPHPDDEVLAAGGLLQQMQQAGVETVLVAVTDGEASHPGVRTQGHDLVARRVEETRVALRRLGCGSMRVQRLCLSDGSVAEQSQYLTGVLSRLLRPDDLCVAPWRSDGHPDHDAAGRAAIAAAAPDRGAGPRVLGLGLALGHTRRCAYTLATMSSSGPAATANRTQALGDLRLHLADQDSRQ